MVILPLFRRCLSSVVPAAAAILQIACSDQLVAPDPEPASPDPVIAPPANLEVLGRGDVPERYTAELNVRGTFAYTTSWGARTSSTGSAPGNAIKIWNVSGNIPLLLDSLIVPQARTMGDIQISDDGKLLVAATEGQSGSIVIYSLDNPAKPAFLSRFSNSNTDPGVHTAEVQRVNGTLYAFLSVDPRSGVRARLVIVNLADPANPKEVYSASMGNPYVHDVFVRDGVLFTALWDEGLELFDIGGAAKGGSPASPVSLGKVRTVGGEVHNVWWYHDSSGAKKYAFVGQEGPGSLGASSAGDIHVVDVSIFSNPREVAFFSLPNAGTHNFSVDESKGILYAAYYNAGVQALDVTGDLSACATAQRSPDGRCDLAKMGRLKATGLLSAGIPLSVWGVQFLNGFVYASDMLNGLWKLRALQ